MSHAKCSSLAQLVQDRIEEWHRGGAPDAAEVIAEHPELRGAKSLFMELVQTEYALRRDAGDEVPREAFVGKYDVYRSAVMHMIAAEDFLDRCPQFNDRLDVQRWPKTGDKFLGYELVEPLGRGGLARVFLAREVDVGGRFVVLKVSPFGENEAHTLGRLAHPSIVPIHTVKFDELTGLSAICMPLVGVATGIDLLDAAFGKDAAPPSGATVAHVARKTRPLAQVPMEAQEKGSPLQRLSYGEAIARLGLELAEGLAKSHACGILHRDLKPSNVLLGFGGRAMLLDFNLSTDAESEERGIGGTLPYMAPEIVHSLVHDAGEQARQFDPRSDLYSLGAVLFELLCGRMPHALDTGADAADARAWLAVKQRPVDALPAGSLADSRLAAMVLKCLAVDPAERYQTADELLAALRAYLNPPARLVRLAVRKRREIVLGVALACLAWLGLAAYVGSRPTELEALQRRGVELYDAGKFAEAAETFSQALDIKPSYAPARFGRAQSLRRMGKYVEARVDYLALKEIEPAWAHALAGYCSLAAKDYLGAIQDYLCADEHDLSDPDALMNFALAYRNRGRNLEAGTIYGRVTEVDPTNKLAYRERAQTLLKVTRNEMGVPPLPDVFASALKYLEFEPNYRGSYFCAYVWAEAASKNPAYREAAASYLSDSIRRGLPKANVRGLSEHMRTLLPLIDESLLESAPETEIFRMWPPSASEPPQMADWQVFARTHGKRLTVADSR